MFFICMSGETNQVNPVVILNMSKKFVYMDFLKYGGRVKSDSFLSLSTCIFI